MALTWKLSEIRAEFRKLTGRSSTDDISDANADNAINDYWVNHFPTDARVDRFDGFFTQALAATDDGDYDLSTDVERLSDPVLIDTRDSSTNHSSGGLGHGRRSTGNTGLRLYTDRKDFFRTYPGREQYVTAPGLAIGSGDSTKVLHDAFDYRINDYAYSKATSEVALTGSAIPEDKYGAWSLKIDTDGTITVAAASGNATGYATPRLALEALTASDGDSAFMGYVTVMKSDGAFTPATTALDAANVTDTYTDGLWETRKQPEACLLYGGKLYVRSKANDIYQLEFSDIGNRPTAFSGDASLPNDAKWGPMIAHGSAILYLRKVHDNDGADELLGAFKYYQDKILGDKMRVFQDSEVQRSF